MDDVRKSLAPEPLTPEDVRIRSLPDGAFLAEMAAVDSALRICATYRWGDNDHARPVCHTWLLQHKLPLYVGEMVRRAAAAQGIGLREPGVVLADGFDLEATLARLREG